MYDLATEAINVSTSTSLHICM